MLKKTKAVSSKEKDAPSQTIQTAAKVDKVCRNVKWDIIIASYLNMYTHLPACLNIYRYMFIYLTDMC